MKRRYRAIRAQAQNWPAHQLALRLKLMLDQESITEANWGCIDAVTDLLGGIEPPSKLL
jgi:hypothetical protein